MRIIPLPGSELWIVNIMCIPIQYVHNETWSNVISIYTGEESSLKKELTSNEYLATDELVFINKNREGIVVLGENSFNDMPKLIKELKDLNMIFRVILLNFNPSKISKIIFEELQNMYLKLNVFDILFPSLSADQILVKIKNRYKESIKYKCRPSIDGLDPNIRSYTLVGYYNEDYFLSNFNNYVFAKEVARILDIIRENIKTPFKITSIGDDCTLVMEFVGVGELKFEIYDQKISWVIKRRKFYSPKGIFFSEKYTDIYEALPVLIKDVNSIL